MSSMSERRRATMSLPRRLASAVITGAVVATGLVANPAPASAAAHAAPWRFTTVSLASSLTAWDGADPEKSWALECPIGYIPVSGGITGGDVADGIIRMLEYPDPATRRYVITARNNGNSGTTIGLTALCVWLDDVGLITTVTGTFTRNADGHAGGIVRCPQGTTVLSGGVDWSDTNSHRDIAFSTPITDGGTTGTGWYAAGESQTGFLGIDLKCVSSSLLAGEYVEATDSPTAGASSTQAVATAGCIEGYRILTGGSAPPAGSMNPGVEQGHSHISAPLTPKIWRATGLINPGIAIRALALCIPASTPTVVITQKPADPSTLSVGQITFIASDAAGEDLEIACSLDDDARSCASGTPVSYGPLPDGEHSFQVLITNKSGRQAYARYQWDVDATVPTITSHTPSPMSLAGPLDIAFSEDVTGVGAAMTVHAQSANTNVSGTITRPASNTARWTPAKPLVPGETYRVTLTSAIHDTAGNPLTATFFDVRARNTVDNASSALQKLWDRDGSTAASGGAYIVDRLAGSRADLTFTATAGQTVSIYGLRMPDGGYADVYLDGVKKATPSFYAATTARVRVYLSGALSAGKHTISIRPTGTKPAAASAAWVRVDNLLVGATTFQETAMAQLFRTFTDAAAYDGSYAQVGGKSGTDTTPAQFRLTGVGTGVKVYATKTSTSGSARVYVDGVLKTTINLNSASTVYKALVYSGTFALGVHTVRVEVVGTTTGTGSTVNLDRITLT